ncbi:MMPL family transporter [Corynebacterium choanae]|uniref:Membrane protein YdfJ n=1 Tax=Corynebacterium choanae TaxID=1862358 RepID=A0A3G6J3R4_9CORY|nr:MMPL family transporter [Corynebacterium choanae]AZA12582.1 Membrane protein YdfJ [Corynebacterium choanae]
MFGRWGSFAYRHAKVVPVVVLSIILGVYLLAGTQLDKRLSQEGWVDPNSGSTYAQNLELDTFGRDNSGDVIVMFFAPAGQSMADPDNRTAMASYLEVIKATHPDEVAEVVSYSDALNPQLISPEGDTAFAAIGLRGDGEQTLRDFRALAPEVATDGSTVDLAGGVQVRIAGATAIADALDKGMADDIHRAEIYALPAVGVLLLLVFGSLVAAGMPLIVGVLSILGSLGVLSMLATVTQVNVFAQSVVTLLGLGLAIDYGLFMVSRFREELSRGADTRQAVITTTATAGKTVVFSAGMVMVALSGLFLFPQAFLKSIAYGAISAVGLAAVLSLCVLPCLFTLLGRRIDALTIRKQDFSRDPEQGIFGRVPAFAQRHATLTTVGLVGGLLALTIPLAGVSFGGINETYLPPAHATRQAQERFDATFPQFRTDPVKLVVTNATDTELASIYAQANQVTGLTGRFKIASETKDATTVLSAGIADRTQNKAVIDQLRALDVPGDAKVYIGGTPALEVESIEALFDTLPWMAIYIVIATFLLMSLTFGSMILPAKAIIMTILGLGATLGILTAMFVDGFGADLFGYTAGPLMSPVLVLIVCIVYGLSTDYEVFLVSRMVEARQRGMSTSRAIRYGTAHTGSIITAAALIMIVVCGAFGFSDIVMMKYIAFGMIAALVLDATVIRMLLVPAVMELLQEDNWWAPRWVKRASRHLGHGEHSPALQVTPPAANIKLAPPVAAATTASAPAASTTESTAAADDFAIRKQPSAAPRQYPIRHLPPRDEHAITSPPHPEAVNQRTTASPATFTPHSQSEHTSPEQQDHPGETKGVTPVSDSENTNRDAHTPTSSHTAEEPVAQRGGRTTADDGNLVSFAELKDKLQPVDGPRDRVHHHGSRVARRRRNRRGNQ